MKEYSDNDSPNKLEDIFRSKFEEAEVTPPDRVWSRIEQGLDLKEAGYYKDKLAWYRSVAAACIALVVFAGGYLIYDLKTEHRPLVAAKPNTNYPNIQKQTTASDISASNNKTLSNGKSSGTQDLANYSAPVAQSESIKNNRTIRLKSTQANPKIDSNLNLSGNGGGDNLTLAIAKPEIQPKNIYNAESANLTGTGISNKAELMGNEESSTSNRFAVNSLEPVLSRFDLSRFTKLPDSLKYIKQELKVLPEGTYLAANEENNASKTGRWTITGKYAPQYFNQHISFGETTRSYSTVYSFNNLGTTAALSAPTSYSDALNEYDKNTKPLYSYNTSIAAGYRLNKHLNLETGADFTENIAHTNSSYIFNNSQIAARLNASSNKAADAQSANEKIAALPTTAFLASITGQANNVDRSISKTTTFNTRYRYRLIGIPVKISYQTSRTKSFYYASVGMVTNLLMQAHIISDSERVPTIKYAANADSPFRSWQFAAAAGIGKGFRISKTIDFKAGLEATQYLTSLAANPENLNGKQKKPYSVGVALSSSYTLGK